jgi:hypothetical protein
VEGRVAAAHGIEFDDLYAITNMPISRFLAWLERAGTSRGICSGSSTAFNPRAARSVMCRNTLSVGWDGRLVRLRLQPDARARSRFRRAAHLRDFELALLDERRDHDEPHCFGCAAARGVVHGRHGLSGAIGWRNFCNGAVRALE